MAKTTWIEETDKFKCIGPLGYGYIFKEKSVTNYTYGTGANTIKVPHQYKVFDKSDNLIASGELKSFHGCRVRVSSLTCGFDAQGSKASKEKYIAIKNSNAKPALSLTAIDSQLILESIQLNTKALIQLTDLLSVLLSRITVKSSQGPNNTPNNPPASKEPHNTP